MAKRIGRRALRYFWEHRNGDEVAFPLATRGYDARYKAVQSLIDAGYLDGDAPRDSGVSLWFRVLRVPTDADVRRS